MEDYRIKLDNLKKEVSVASNYFLLSDLVKEYQELSEQLLRDYSNHEFFLRIESEDLLLGEKENKDNLKIANKENN